MMVPNSPEICQRARIVQGFLSICVAKTSFRPFRLFFILRRFRVFWKEEIFSFVSSNSENGFLIKMYDKIDLYKVEVINGRMINLY